MNLVRIGFFPIYLELFRLYRRKMGWEPWADEQPTKVQKIFQLSITALSFLAFGGYLLCMIVQAIKSKGTVRLL